MKNPTRTTTTRVIPRSLAFGHRQQNVSEGTRINVIFVKLGQEMLGIHLVLLIDNNYP